MREEFEVRQISRRIEDNRLDPIAVSKAYYDRALVNLRAGALLDGLIDLRLAEDHLIGDLAPRHKYIDPEISPLHRTLGHLVFYQRMARQQMFELGPGRQLEPRVSISGPNRASMPKEGVGHSPNGRNYSDDQSA